jgi:hypothetical protein
MSEAISGGGLSACYPHFAVLMRATVPFAPQENPSYGLRRFPFREHTKTSRARGPRYGHVGEVVRLKELARSLFGRRVGIWSHHYFDDAFLQ